MAEIKVAKLPSASKMSKRELYATIAYFYPQYTLQEVQELPGRDVILLFDTAKRLQAANNVNLTQIAAAPHTSKGRGVSKLISEFRKIAKV